MEQLQDSSFERYRNVVLKALSVGELRKQQGREIDTAALQLAAQQDPAAEIVAVLGNEHQTGLRARSAPLAAAIIPFDVCNGLRP